jgi:dTDP-4-dehydrorhamnose 3,5-epimerase-like enzyme
VIWNDPELGITWPLDQLSGAQVSVSAKDAKGALLRNAELP